MTVYKAADMAKWGEKAKRNAMLIVRKSIEDVTELAQTSDDFGGRMPVDNGDLRNSFTAGLNGSTVLSGGVEYSAELLGTAVTNLKAGDSFNAGWTAAYALRMEKGFVGDDRLGRTYNQAGNFFMASALAEWQAINDRNAAKVRDT